MEPIRDTKTMTKVMENAGPLAVAAGVNKLANNAAVAESLKNSLKNINSTPSLNNNNAANVANLLKNTPSFNNLNKNKNKNNNNTKAKLLANIGVTEEGLVSGSENASMKNIDIGEDELKGSIASENEPKNNIKLNSSKNANKSNNNKNKNKLNLKEATAPSPLNSFPVEDEPTNVKAPSVNLKKEAEEIISLQAPLTSTNITTANIPIKPVTPPSINSNSDMVHELEPAEKLSGGSYSRNRRGGSLMSAMARTTYTLAPAAALLATAAFVMKGKHKKTRKHSKKSSKTHRRRR
jgi:hypothetical protein